MNIWNLDLFKNNGIGIIWINDNYQLNNVNYIMQNLIIHGIGIISFFNNQLLIFDHYYL